MADSKQLRVLKVLTAHLEGIVPANGYAFDLAGKVFRGKSIFGNETLLPFLTVLEHPNPQDGAPAAEEGRVRHEDWKLLLQGFVKNGDVHETDPAYDLKAEVEKRLAEIIAMKAHGGGPAYPEIYRLANLATSFTIGQGVVRPPDGKISPTAFLYIPLTVKMKTDPLNPYGD